VRQRAPDAGAPRGDPRVEHASVGLPVEHLTHRCTFNAQPDANVAELAGASSQTAPMPGTGQPGKVSFDPCVLNPLPGRAVMNLFQHSYARR
jgi:hypothetical protein